MSGFSPVRTIQRKRDGETLSTDEITAFIEGYTSGTIPDYQMAALNMAVFFRGMDTRETADLTRVIIASGERFDWARGGCPAVVDKHSTGGQGDKVSLILAPVLAACGLRVPSIAGRGLGPTGGTIDKLEAIPGFRTALSIAEIERQCDEIGCAIASQSEEFCPADKKLYALRDVTATVASIPLITASILSKKLAEDLDALVLDVKWGSGAFMRSLEDARELASSMANAAREFGVATRALITDMNQPLGRVVGNANEVRESIEVLEGGGPDDVREVTIALGAELLVATKLAKDREDAAEKLAGVIDSGDAYAKFEQMVNAQGSGLDELPDLAPTTAIEATKAGYVSAIDGERLGYAVIALGGGRRVVEDHVDPTVGLTMRVRLGDRVECGDLLVEMHAGGKGADEARRVVSEAFSIEKEPVEALSLVAYRHE